MAIEEIGSRSGPTGEYASRGDYHRNLDPQWDYFPTYLAKMSAVRAYLDALPARTRILDAGCGEGVLVDEYADRLAIVGVDAHYTSSRVRSGSLLELPFGPASFDRVLCLDVLEHLGYDHQVRAMAEMYRVLEPGGEAVWSIPNLAHLQSRLKFVLTGELVRTSNPSKHPGDRPIGEYLDAARRVGFVVTKRVGIFPTVPVLARLIRRRPRQLAWLHRALTTLLPIPGWCFLNLVWLSKPIPGNHDAA